MLFCWYFCTSLAFIVAFYLICCSYFCKLLLYGLHVLVPDVLTCFSCMRKGYTHKNLLLFAAWQFSQRFALLKGTSAVVAKAAASVIHSLHLLWFPLPLRGFRRAVVL